MRLLLCLPLATTFVGCDALSPEPGSASTEATEQADGPSTQDPQSTRERLSALPDHELVNPEDDEVMQYIAGAIPEVSDAQLEQLYELYTGFREEQARALSLAVRMNEATGRGGGRGGRGARAGRGGGGSEGGVQLRPRQLERIGALETDFLSAGRELMQPAQLSAWDECATAVDLGPNLSETPELGLEPGEPAPDFELRTLDGEELSLSDLRGKPVVVEFGSYTCPIFRDNASEMRSLARRYRDQAHFLLVYGYEAHPDDGWQVKSNRDQGIIYDQHRTMDERRAAARDGVEALDIESTVVLDGMDNAVTDAWSGHPNVGYVIDAEGRIATRMGIIDPVEVQSLLER